MIQPPNHNPAATGNRYSGVVLELGNPGRNDSRGLIGGASHYVLTEALSGLNTSRYAMDLRTRECPAPYPPGTKVVLLAGHRALPKLGYAPERLNSLRGTPFLRDGIIYIPTYHPQDAADRKNYEATLNQYIEHQDSDSDDSDSDSDDSEVKDMGSTARRNFRFWFIQDVRKAFGIARNGYAPNRCTYHTRVSAPALCAMMHEWQGENIGIDIETERATGRMLCFAFAKSVTDVYVVPLVDYRGGLVYGSAESAKIMQALTVMFRRNTIIAHNSLFDLFILMWRYRIPPPPQAQIRDTMIQHARIHVDVEKSLGHCISLYTHQPYHKDEGIFNPHNDAQFQQLLEYNGKDVEGMLLVDRRQLDIASKDRGLRDSLEQGNSLIRPMLLKSLRGLNINKTLLCQKIDENAKRAVILETRVLSKLAGGPLNPRSPKQVATVLYEKFGLPKSSDPRVSLTGKDQLYRLALKYPLPILKVILHIRKLSKEAGQISCKLWRDTKITCAYIITGTKTFRLSSRRLLDTWGTNTQNWAKQTRRLVEARPGHVLVQVDQSGAEALIVAYLAPHGRYRDLFIHRVSPHVYTGLWLFPEVWQAELGYDVRYLFEVPIASLKNDSRWPEVARCIKASDGNPPHRRYYYFAKQTNHSSNYDIQPAMFAKNLLDKSEGQVSLPVMTCAKFLDTYHTQLYPEIRAGFHNYVKARLIKDKMLRNMFGYPRQFYGLVDDPTVLKDAYSWIPQSSVGVITCRADAALQQRIDAGELKFAIWQNNHDSLLSETPEGTEVETAKEMCAAMNQRMINFRGEEFAMRSEASVGPNWYEMEEIKL